MGWYKPGNWNLPDWWTDYPPASRGHRCTHAEQTVFYNGWFVREVLKHEGGITTLPKKF